MVGIAHLTSIRFCMSEELRNRLRFYRESRLLVNFFSEMSGIEVLQYDARSTGFAEIGSQLEEFSRISSIPSSRIPIESSVEVVECWIGSIVTESKIQSPVYLRMSNYWTMGWTQVDVKDVEEFLMIIWDLDKNVQIVDSPRERLSQRHCSSLL